MRKRQHYPRKMFKQLIQLTHQTYNDDGQNEFLLYCLARTYWEGVICSIWNAMKNPSHEITCVLFEYQWTNRLKHSRNIVERLPNGMLFHDALIHFKMETLLTEMFGNPNISVYRRRKWSRGVEDIHTMEVVVRFRPYAFLPAPSPIEARNVTARTISTLDWTPNN